MQGQVTARRRILLAGIALMGLLLPAVPSLGNGLIISPVGNQDVTRWPRPHRRPIHSWMPFRVKSQRVDVEINDAVSETRIEQVFVNRGPRQAEGTYLFPIAEDAGVHSFTMWMNGREVTGELLDADRARRIYESIVSKMRDPGLLQFAGRGLIQAKVFPIPAGGECRIKLRYSEPVRSDSGLSGYRFPLGSAGCRFEPIEQFSLRAVVRSTRPLSSVFCASHDCSIDRRSDREVVVGLEKNRLQPENDFQLFYQFGDAPFGLSMLSYREGGQDGFFMARITPRISGEKDAVLPKNIVFVLDTSGSMAEDNKIAQAKNALKFCVTNLGKEDRFNILTFATDIRSFREGWSTAEEATKSAARSFIDDMIAVGGTDIDSALGRALTMNPAKAAWKSSADQPAWRSYPFFVVFITDGEPTVGETNPEAIIKNVASANHGKLLGSPKRRILKPADFGVGVSDARIFCLGVGFKVNTQLLDRLADDNGGARGYVTPSEDLELKISAFYTKLANPVLAGLKLVFQGVNVHDLYPRSLPDLFKGSELVVVGRYGDASGSRPRKVELTGRCRGEARKYEFDCVFDGDTRRHSFLPRVWAMRKIGFLLDELRLHGQQQELKNEVIRLSKRYGILTPYTSYLVQEDERLAVRDRRAPMGPRNLRGLGYAFDRNQADMEAARKGQGGRRGGGAVAASKGNYAMRRAKPASMARRFKAEMEKQNQDAAGQQLVNFIGARTFYLEDGRWVDADYDGKAKTTRLVMYSKDYYDFLAGNAEAGRYLAQSDRVVLNWGGRMYETVPAEPDTQPAP